VTGTTAVDADEARRLRDAMTDKLVKQGRITSAAIEAAFREVPRHAFARPGNSLEDCYHRSIVRNKKDADGVTVLLVLGMTDARNSDPLEHQPLFLINSVTQHRLRDPMCVPGLPGAPQVHERSTSGPCQSPPRPSATDPATRVRRQATKDNRAPTVTFCTALGCVPSRENFRDRRFRTIGLDLSG
jgi:hypothetical protein